MRRATLFLIPLAAPFVFFVAGCGGGGGSIPSFGASGHTAYYYSIQTNTTTPNEAWPNVSISGYADPNYLAGACNPASDQYCIPQVYPPGGGNYDQYGAFDENAINSFATNGNGEAYFYTDAEPSVWHFYAQGPTSADCPSTTASLVTYQSEGIGAGVLLSCNSFAASMTASPSSCETGFINEKPVNTCPATVTLAFPASEGNAVVLPLNTSLAADNYDTSGDELRQSSVSASTQASVNVPTPSAGGLTYLAVRNPSTNQILGVGEFTVNVVDECTQVATASPAGAGVQPLMNKCP